MNQALSQHPIGLSVLQFTCLKIDPPAAVVPAFLMVSSAREDRERYINEAETRGETTVSRGRSDRWAAIQKAEGNGYAAIHGAESETARLKALFEACSGNKPALTDLLRMESLETVMKDRPKLFLGPDQPPLFIDLRPQKGMIP